ncbi:MAG: MFS transporter, partial [Gammaproteobacteria bacterium]|nr:MFS transporter [Gammaproteobacteria bacterium]
MNMRPNKWLIILAIGIMHTAINIDFTAVNLAVAPIVKQFHASLTTAQWIINSYLLGSICLMIASGKIADMVGKRKIFLWGATIFTIASGLAGVAINQEWLITARFLQGIAVAIIFPVAMSIAFTSFPQKQRGLAMAIMLTIGGLAQSFGPVFGGIMVHFASWRWIFLINVPLGLFSIIATSILYPADNITTPEQSIDYRGIILIATALLLLSFGLNEIEQLGINSILLWSSLGAGAVLLLILGWHANQTANPIIELNCFKNRKFSTILIIRILIGYCWLALLFPIGLYLQNVLGYSALYAGLVLLAMSLMFGTLSPLAGKLIDRVGSKIPLIIGISLAIISFICFMQLPTNIGWQNL